MTTTKTGASASAGASVRSTNGRGKSFKIRGVTVLVPPKVPFRTLKQLAALADAGDEAKTTDLIQALEMVLGEEQMERIWGIDVDVSAGTGEALQLLLLEVYSKTLKATGMAAGES